MIEPVAHGGPEAPSVFESGGTDEQLPGLRELFAGVLNRWPLVLAVLLCGVLVGSYFASAPRRYSTSAMLRIQPSNASALEISPSQLLGGQSGSDEKINSEVAIMQSRTILLKVAEDLKLQDDPDFWAAKKAPQLSMSDPHARDMVVGRMRKILVFDRPPKSDLVNIVCTTPSPLLSAKIANSITNAYIARVFQVRYGSTERVSSWLISQLTDLKNQVEHDQEDLVGLQSKLGVVGLDQKNSAYLLADSLEGITKASSEATIGRILAETKLRVLNSSDPNLIEGAQPLLQGQSASTAGGLLQQLRNSQAEAAAAYANLSARLGPAYPDVKQAKARLDELNRQVRIEQQRIVNQARTSYSAASDNEKMTSNVLKALTKKAFASRSDMVRYVILQRQYEGDRTLYEGLTQRLRVAGINAGLESAQVDVIDLADVPSVARAPLPWQWFVLFTVSSLVLGILLAVLADQLNRRLTRPEEAEKLLRLPLLALLHRFNQTGRLTNFRELKSGPYAEGIQLLRGSVLMSQPGRAPKAILITSAVPGEGKSTVSRGLAAMLAMHKAKVLLIDADLHRPVQALQMEPRPILGLSDILTSGIDPFEVIIPVAAVEGLFLLPAGRCPPQPATLLSSPRMSQVFDQLKENFDFIVVDSPPVLRVADTILLIPLIESVVLIVRQNLAEVRDIRQAISMLRRGHANIIGFALNTINSLGTAYYGSYGSYGTYGASNEPGGEA